MEVIEDEKQVAVEEDGVQIEEIIEESPPDQGNMVANAFAKRKPYIHHYFFSKISPMIWRESF